MIKKIFLIIALFISLLSFIFIPNIEAESDITSSDFTINVGDISPGNPDLIKGGTKATTNNLLQTIMNKMMVAFGVLSLFVMTIGGGYMIMYHGQDELLSKGKSIFTAGLVGLVVALGAGLLVKLVAYLIY